MNKIFKRTIAFILLVSITMLTLPFNAFADDTEEVYTLLSEYIKVEVSSKNGGFHIDTVMGDKLEKDDDNKMLLHNSSDYDTSFTSFQITADGKEKDYIFGRSYGFLGLSGTDIHTEKAAGSIISVWTVEDIEITQRIELVNNSSAEHGMVLISYTAKNTGSKQVDSIKARVMLDTALGYQDYAYYKIPDNGTYITVENETILDGSSMGSMMFGYDDEFMPSVTAYTVNSVVEDKECVPEKVAFGHWNNLASTVYDFTPNADLTFTNEYNAQYLTADSAYALYYDMGSLDAGAQSSIATNYGVYSNADVADGTKLAINISGAVPLALNADKTAYISLNEQDAEGEITLTANIKNFTDSAIENVRIVVYPDELMTPIDENGSTVSPGGETYSSENPFSVTYSSFAGDQTNIVDFRFKAQINKTATYRKIELVAYKMDEDSGLLLQDNIIGRQSVYILCPGTDDGIPDVVLTGCTEYMYYTGKQRLSVTGIGLNMLTDQGTYSFKLKQITGEDTYGAVIPIESENSVINFEDNTIDITVPEFVDEKTGLEKLWPTGVYQLVIDYVDSEKPEVASTPARVIVTDDPQYSNLNYGVIAIEQTGFANPSVEDCTYEVKPFPNEAIYKEYIDNNPDAEILVELKGDFSDERVDKYDGSVYYEATVINSNNNTKNPVTLNNSMELRSGYIKVITENKGKSDQTILVDIDGNMRILGTGTLVHDGTAELTEIKNGIDYDLRKYTDEGIRCSTLPELDPRRQNMANKKTITYVFEEVFDLFVSIMNIVNADLTFGELGAMVDGNNKEITKLVSFAARIDLGLLVPKGSKEFKANFDSAWKDYQEKAAVARLERELAYAYGKKYTGPSIRDTYNGFMESKYAQQYAARKSKGLIEATAEVEDILFGGGSCIGCNFSVNIGLPPLTSTMPGISGTLTVGTIAAWRFDVEGYAEFTGLTVEAKLGVVYSDKIAGPMVDDLYLYVEFPPSGFNIDGFGVVWLRGGGGGINNLYELVYTPATLPSTSIVMSVAASVIQVILLKINLEVGLTGVSLVAERGTLSETGILVLRNSGVRFQWYPSFKFSGNVNVDLLGIINGSGYIVVDPAASSYEFFAMVSLMVPLAFPLIGGITVGSVGVGVNEDRIWGKATIIGLSFGVLYYWGGNFSFVAGDNKGLEPSYPELLSVRDVPVAYDEETGKTMYAHIVPTFSLAGTASVSNDAALLAAENEDGELVLLSNADKTKHLLNLGFDNGDNGALNIKYTAESMEEAINIAQSIVIKDRDSDESYPLTVLSEDGSNADTANAYVVYDTEGGTKEARVVVSFTERSSFYTNWEITTAVPSVLEIYNVANLPEFSLNKAEIKDSKVDMEWNVKVGADEYQYSRLEKISVYAVSDKENHEDLGILLGTIEDEAVLANGKATFDAPADLPSGEYYIKAVATMDETLVDTVITDTACKFTNSLQPKAADKAVVSSAGDYRLKVSVTDDGTSCDGYQVNLYEVSKNEQNQTVYTELSNVSGTMFASGDELIVGGRYELKPEEGAETQETEYVGLEAGKTYAAGVRRVRYLLDADGNQTGMVTSEETFTEGIVMTMPNPPEVTATVMSANGETAVELSVGKVGEIDMKLPTVITEDAKIKLSSNMPISGKWYLNNTSYEEAEENELDGTFGTFESSSEIIIDLTGLETQEHSLKIDGVNANGDGFTKNVRFVVDTYTPMLALNSPLTGSAATAADEIIIDGRTEADAKLKVEVNGILIGEKTPKEWDSSSEDGSFAFTVPADKTILKNKLTLTATDKAGNATKENITVINRRYTDISGVRIYLDGEDVTGKQLNTKEGIAGKLDLMGITEGSEVFVINDEAMIEWNTFTVSGSIKVYENGEEISLMSAGGSAHTDRTILIGENSNGMISGMLRLTSDSGLSAATGLGINGSHQITYDNSDRVIISVSPKTADAGDTVTVSAVVKEGYQFTGWTSNSADVTFADPTATQTTFIMPDSDVHITATVPGTSYAVTLNPNGGTVNSGNITSYEYGTGAVLPTDVTKSGYIFGGWYETEDFTGSAVTEITSSDSGNKTYYAKWIGKQEVVIDDAVQTYPYNPDGNEFVIENTTLTGFKVEYYVNNVWTEAAPTEIGSYNVRITRAEDTQYAAFSRTIENGYVIAHAMVTKPIADTTIFTYDGTEKVYGIGATDDYNVIGNTRTAAGSQTVTVELNDKVHFIWDDGSTENITFTFKVNPRVVEVSWSEASFVYDGNEKSITPSLTNKIADDEVNLTVGGTTSATEKGNYTATVTSVDNPNYTIEGSENLVKIWAISETTNTWETELAITGWTYGEPANVPTATSKFGEVVFTYSDSIVGAYTETVPTNAGTYYVKATVTGTENYAELVSTKEFTILQKQISPVITLTVPVKNETPQTEIIGDGYTATVVWSPEVSAKFGYNTEYTATITITVDNNHTADGITTYTVEGAKTVANEENSNVITATYEKTGSSSSGGSGGGGVSRYTIRFETNGGTAIASKAVIRNSKLEKPEAPAKEGYSFSGWFTDEELTEAYDFDKAVTKNITLYAKWEKHDDEAHKPETPDEECDGTEADGCASLGFEDLDVKAWYHHDVDYAIENGIFRGVTENKFAPDDKLTRAMLVTVLYRVEGEPAVNKSIPFKDTDMSSYYADAVIWAQQNGIVNGVSENEFAPDENITREQIAAIMHRYAKFKGYDVTVGENTNILSYDDESDISEYAISSMQYAVGSGLIKGKSESTLNPKDNATRAEIAAILHRFIEANK